MDKCSLWEKKHNEQTHNLIRWAVFWGGIRGLLRIPLEHPLDRVKTQWQVDPSQGNALQVVRQLYKAGGIREFYAGAVPSGARFVAREMYRFPLMLELPNYFERVFSTLQRLKGQRSHDEKESLQPPDACRRPFLRTLSGFAIATLEAFISCPFERLKVTFMTLDGKERYKIIHSILARHWLIASPAPNSGGSSMKTVSQRQEIFRLSSVMECTRFLFSGISPLWLRQLVSWGSVLGADAQCRAWARGVRRTEELDMLTLGIVAVLVSVFSTTMVMPFDAIKTHFQRAQPPKGVALTIGSVARWIYQKYGYRGFFVGYIVRLCQYQLNALLTVPLLEHLERQRRRA